MQLVLYSLCGFIQVIVIGSKSAATVLPSPHDNTSCQRGNVRLIRTSVKGDPPSASCAVTLAFPYGFLLNV